MSPEEPSELQWAPKSSAAAPFSPLLLTLPLLLKTVNIITMIIIIIKITIIIIMIIKW